MVSRAAPQGSRHRDDDRTLVARLRGGDEGALEQLFQTYYGSLTRFARQYVHYVSAADEIVADVFVALWEVRLRLAPDVNLASYLFRSVRNRARNYLRDQRTAETYLTRAATETAPGIGERGVAPDVWLEIEERESRLWRAVATLPERSRVLIGLRWRDGLTPAEIAATLEISVTAVNTGVSRALKALRGILSEDFR